MLGNWNLEKYEGDFLTLRDSLDPENDSDR